MKLKAIVMTVSLASAPLCASAATWEELDASKQEVLFIDRTSLHQDSGITKVRVLHNYHQTAYLGDDVYPHKSKVIVYEVDCAKGELGYAQWSLHAADLGSGDTVWADGANGVAMFAPADSEPEAALLARVCKPSRVAQH